MNVLQIIGILAIVISIIAIAAGIIFIKKDLMDPKGAIIIIVIGVINFLVGIGLICFGAYQNHQQKLIQQQEVLMAKKKAIAEKQLKRKKEAEAERRKLMGQDDNLQSSEITMRQLTPQQYAMMPHTIYRMYNQKGQDFFDAQYDTGETKNYALKHIGLTLPDLVFKTTTNQTARVDNLKGDNRKVVLTLLNIEHDPKNENVITNANEIDTELRLLQGMALNYPDVNFIITFPNNDRTTWNAFLKTVNNSIADTYRNYKLIVLGSENNNIGSNYGSLKNFANKTLNWKDKDTLIAIDKHDRIALVEYNNISTGNSSGDGQTMLTRLVNLAFTQNDAQKVYNMLKSDTKVKEIQDAGDQGLTNDNITGQTVQKYKKTGDD